MVLITMYNIATAIWKYDGIWDNSTIQEKYPQIIILEVVVMEK